MSPRADFDDPHRAFEIDVQGHSFLVRVARDPWPPSPRRRRGNIAHLVQLEPNGTVMPDPDRPLRTHAMRAWELWHDEERLSRYLRAFHYIVACAVGAPRRNGRILGYVAHADLVRMHPDASADATAALAARVIDDEVRAYLQWYDDTIFAMQVSDPVDQRAVTLSGIYTASGTCNDPHIDHVAQHLAVTLAATRVPPRPGHGYPSVMQSTNHAGYRPAVAS